MVNETDKQFISEVHGYLGELHDEIARRNEDIENLDKYIYGDLLENSLDIPVGHDRTPINWLKRSVSIHKDQFMGRGFQLTSSYDSRDLSIVEDEEDKKRIKLENDMSKAHAQQRRKAVEAIKKDNGGDSLWLQAAENASAIGDTVIKSWYDKSEKKWRLSLVERVENFYRFWESSDFREGCFDAYAWQISLQEAVEDYGVSEKTPTSPLGKPMVGKTYATETQQSTRPMVTVVEVTGKVPGWKVVNGSIRRCKIGMEKPMNVVLVGNQVASVIDEEKDMPRYYILPNKRQRARPWGVSDISNAAIGINQTYIEALSDWRTVSSKVNFPKWKALGFQLGQQLPKPKPRKAEILPLGPDQDIQPIQDAIGNAQFDFKQQMEELKEQFVRETGLSPILFNDPSININSNQALLTSMKPTTDIAEAKKALWGPIIVEMFEDALNTLAEHEPDAYKEIVSDDEAWSLQIRWPSHMPKEDPVYQSNMINRFNANLISVQSYLEAMGDSSEEMDRIRDELEDPITSAILGRIVNQYAAQKISPPKQGPEEPRVSVNLRGDLTPYQEANLASMHGFNQGPFPPTAGPQGNQGMIAQENADNAGFINGNPFNGGTPIQRGPDGQEVSANQQQQPQQVSPPGTNQEGQGIISQPGSGATPVSAEGAVNQDQQQAGR